MLRPVIEDVPLKAVGVEELGFGFTTVGAFSIPPFRSVTAERVTRSSRNGVVLSRDREKWARPLFVAPSCLPLKNYLIKVNKMFT